MPQRLGDKQCQVPLSLTTESFCWSTMTPVPVSFLPAGISKEAVMINVFFLVSRHLLQYPTCHKMIISFVLAINNVSTLCAVYCCLFKYFFCINAKKNIHRAGHVRSSICPQAGSDTAVVK
jgi:hypothetical protein